MSQGHEFILTLSCRDATGIVYAVSGLLYQGGCNIIDSQQFGDLQGDDATGLFFMRVHFQAPPQLAGVDTLDTLFEHTRQRFAMDARFHALAARPRTVWFSPAYHPGQLFSPQPCRVRLLVSPHPRALGPPVPSGDKRQPSGGTGGRRRGTMKNPRVDFRRSLSHP